MKTRFVCFLDNFRYEMNELKKRITERIIRFRVCFNNDTCDKFGYDKL